MTRSDAACVATDSYKGSTAQSPVHTRSQKGPNECRCCCFFLPILCVNGSRAKGLDTRRSSVKAWTPAAPVFSLIHTQTHKRLRRDAVARRTQKPHRLYIPNPSRPWAERHLSHIPMNKYHTLKHNRDLPASGPCILLLNIFEDAQWQVLGSPY